MNRSSTGHHMTNCIVCGALTAPPSSGGRNRHEERCSRCGMPLVRRSDDQVLRVEGLQHYYGSGPARVEAVRQFDLLVRPSEVILIVGPSGGGKTTALLAMGLLLSPSSGTITIGGINGSELNEVGRARHRLLHIGFVFQQFNLIPSLNAVQNVSLPLRYAGVKRRYAESRALGLLSSLGLGHKAGSLPMMMSGGERQRVSIARAMVSSPSLLLADEPTANLDSRAGKIVAEQIARAAGATEAGAVIVTHDTRLADEAERVLVLEDGILRPQEETHKKRDDDQ